ncbi:MAG: RidA family protein [Cereibacter sphaeroides]|uniref:RidA family protein n=1 Tax=Cereibacter sphaeroides TaxID=1063 RepID=A0A2W5SCC3_CERSP|nr:MAG: RidA family protein [Cereibacter sphaeroides]
MTTIRRWNPEGIAAPASRYQHAVLTTEAKQWLHLSGQIGVRPDGTTADGLATQLDACFANIDAGLASAGMDHSNVIKITVYLTIGTPEAIATYRARRDAWVGDGPLPAGTLLVVAALAGPAWLAEVDCIAAA